MPAFQNITDKTFGRLTALRLVGKNRFGHNLWECRCSCGNPHTVSILQLNKGTPKNVLRESAHTMVVIDSGGGLEIGKI